MTTASAAARTDYSSDGQVTDFDLKFTLRQTDHLKVFKCAAGQDPVLQVQGADADYTLHDHTDIRLARVSFNDAPAEDTDIILLRDVPVADEPGYIADQALPTAAVEDTVARLHLERGDVLTMEMFGAIGDGKPTTDDSAAWDAMITQASSTGKTVVLTSKTYRIPNATRKTLDQNHVTIIGIGKPVLVGGADTELFKPDSHGLTFHNVTTRLICLMRTGSFSADIDRIDIRNWTWENGIDTPIDFAVPPFSGVDLTDIDTMERPTESLRISVNAGADAASTRRIKNLVLRDIRGKGGLGGLAFDCAIENVDIDGYFVENIDVPFLTPIVLEAGVTQAVVDKNNAFNDGHYNGNTMLNAGFGDGLLLGDDSPIAQEICKSWSIGRLSISGTRDNRQQRTGGGIASCDGVRLLGQNMSIGQIDVRDVSSAYFVDTTGVYFKGRDSVVGSIYIENCGGHESGCVLKGARRTNGGNAQGFNISIGTLKLFADDAPSAVDAPAIDLNETEVPDAAHEYMAKVAETSRCALYLAPDDVHIGFLSIEGYGGHVVNSDMERVDGAGSLVFCENTEKQRLQIDRYSIVNCSVGNSLTSASTVSPNVNLFDLQGYRDVKIGPGYVAGISNDRHNAAIRWKMRIDDLANGQSNLPAAEADTLPEVFIFEWADDSTTVDIELVELGPVHAKDVSADIKKVVLYKLKGDARLDHFTAWNPIVDSSIDDGLIANTAPDIGRIQVIGGDLTACTGTKKLLHATTPPATSFIGVNGL